MNRSRTVQPGSLLSRFLQVCRQEGAQGAVRACVDFAARRLMRPDYGFLYKSGPFQPLPGLSEGRPEAVARARSLLRIDPDHRHAIEGQCACLTGEDTCFQGIHTAVVAHWDPHNLVDPYVEYMCRHFKSLGWKVVLSSAARPSPSEVLERREEWCDAVVYRTCDGYDFTSWKAALHCLPNLFESETLILCNDSVFAPVGSFAPVHAEMENIRCDFWGMSASTSVRPHLQSYYLVFSKRVLEHNALKRFFNAVPLSNSREKAVACETSLTLWLCLHGFRAAAYQVAGHRSIVRLDPTTYAWSGCLNNGMPLIKRSLLAPPLKTEGREKKLKTKGYPVELTANYFARTEQYFLSRPTELGNAC